MQLKKKNGRRLLMGKREISRHYFEWKSSRNGQFSSPQNTKQGVLLVTQLKLAFSPRVEILWLGKFTYIEPLIPGLLFSISLLQPRNSWGSNCKVTFETHTWKSFNCSSDEIAKIAITMTFSNFDQISSENQLNFET
jgi:hypothetical protein